MTQQSEHTEFDRLWSALDQTRQALDALEQRLARELPQPRQHGPAPDYRMAEFDGATEPGVAEPCSCDEALDLRGKLIEANKLLRQRPVNRHASEAWAKWDMRVTRHLAGYAHAGQAAPARKVRCQECLSDPMHPGLCVPPESHAP